MNNFLKRVKNILYSLPFGLKAADTEIMGSNISGDGNDTVIQQQVSDERVSKHLLKGEVTKEVEELRYRTYKVSKESKNYSYIGNGMAVKEEKHNGKDKTIKFTQENKLICSDVLTELNRIDCYGVEKYIINISYSYPVRFKLQEFITYVDVVIKDGKNAVTTLRFNDTRNPSSLNSKPFVTELEKLETLFNNNDTYGLSRNDFASSLLSMSFTTYNASDGEPDVVSYGFMEPELIGVHHENGEYKLLYQWKEFKRDDLTDKFFNAELEEKYKNKVKKELKTGINIDDNNPLLIKCSKCGKEINKRMEGYLVSPENGLPLCLECYENYLLELNK